MKEVVLIQLLIYFFCMKWLDNFNRFFNQKRGDLGVFKTKMFYFSLIEFKNKTKGLIIKNVFLGLTLRRSGQFSSRRLHGIEV